MNLLAHVTEHVHIHGEDLISFVIVALLLTFFSLMASKRK